MESKLSSVRFWLIVGIINHCTALAAVSVGCARSRFSCQGEAMNETLSVYTFTLFTPQVALEVILLLAIFLINDSLGSLVKNAKLSALFCLSFAVPLLLVM